MRRELERITPSEAGLSSEIIIKYINSLEKSGTEMHGIMIARHGRVCAEGWWKPYSPVLRHGLQSLTKSYTATAVGLLMGEGKLKLDEKLVDILTEYMPEEISENLGLLTVRDLLCMGSGMENMPDRTKKTWVSDFFSSPFVNQPGSQFYYSGLVTSICGVVVRKKTGMGLMEYLKPRLFDGIGIDYENLKWIEHPDGMEYGGGGLFATTEDNLRLGLLYLNGGVWEGERILNREWVEAATKKQMDSSGEGPKDNSVGYGYQMWMCQPEGVYRFDGAHGQFTIMVPQLDMVISINQFASGDAVQKTLDITWEYLKSAQSGGNEDEALKRKLAGLSVAREKISPEKGAAARLTGKVFVMEKNSLTLTPGVYNMLSHKLPKGIKSIRFEEGRGELLMDVCMADNDYRLYVSMDGVNRLSHVPAAHDLPEMVYATGWWTENNVLKLNLKYIETCYSTEFDIMAVDDKIEVTAFNFAPFAPGGKEEIKVKSL